jgi:fructokinase
MDIVCLGEVLIDMFATEVGKKMTEVETFTPKPGGAPANVAVAAKRLGSETAFIGKVGDDLFGYHLENILTNEGVQTRGMRFDDYARTTMAFIAKPDEYTPEFVFYRNPGADTQLKSEELDLDLLRSTKCLHFGSLSLNEEPCRSATLYAIEVAKSENALISFDVNYRPSLWENREQAYKAVMSIITKIDLLKVNETELELLTGSAELETASKTLLNLGPELIIVTLGSKGSYFLIKEGGHFMEAFKVNTIDAVGCGDAFIAGLLAQLVKTQNWRENLSVDQMKSILKYANAVGAITALTLGVIPALPFANQVEKFLSDKE